MTMKKGGAEEGRGRKEETRRGQRRTEKER